MVTVSELLKRLDQADELEAARRCAAAHRVTLGQMLGEHAPRSPGARALGQLYEVLAERHTKRRVAELTGRHFDTVRQTLRARLDDAYRRRRNLRHCRKADRPQEAL